MEHLTLAAIALFILGFGSVSGRIKTTMLTAPILFVAFGFLLGPEGLALMDLDTEHPIIHFIAEITLILVLFSDAARIDLKRLGREHALPVRLLGLGLPLTMIMGGGIAWLLFPELGLAPALLLGIVLAPTDAALGQVVVSSERVPVRIRQTLNVESGLNDGLALPILIFFICLSGVPGVGEGNWLTLAAMQLILGPLVGIGSGYLGGQLVLWGQRSGWMSDTFQSLSFLGIAFFAFAFAEEIGGNGFLAAFTAGLTLGNTAKGMCQSIYEFGEAEGQLLTLLTFLFFGAVMVAPAFEHVNTHILLYAFLSLTLIRLLPVALSLIGLKQDRYSLLFLGWFGPRGVASILYGLLVLKHLEGDIAESIFNITVITVFFSVLAHGFSAWPGVKWYAKKTGDGEGERAQVEAGNTGRN